MLYRQNLSLTYYETEVLLYCDPTIKHSKIQNEYDKTRGRTIHYYPNKTTDTDSTP